MAQLTQSRFCPLVGKDCLELGCSWYAQIRGVDPNTGKDIDDWACAVNWLPMLLIEGANQSRQCGAAVESFRNEMVKENQRGQMLLAKLAREPLDVTPALPAPRPSHA